MVKYPKRERPALMKVVDVPSPMVFPIFSRDQAARAEAGEVISRAGARKWR